MIDTATRYGCEEQIAEAIEESGVPRSAIFITTKLFYEDYGYDNTLRSFEESLARLKTDYIDLYLMHWPGTKSNKDNRRVRAETWRALVHLYETGKARAIGVSNFMILHLTQLIEDCREVPHVNQVECHCFNHPTRLVAFCWALHFKAIVLLPKASSWTTPQSSKWLSDTPAPRLPNYASDGIFNMATFAYQSRPRFTVWLKTLTCFTLTFQPTTWRSSMAFMTAAT
ncbi:hypothetical protein LEN26_005453 [Aphanomyces euteiches]|nr:hypothetical protein AeMF1_000390 [Aphanomyces euteiches]KAH9138055.1 hypothetical protein LEN26_005453 [Aphanomyces euteiches]KAH9193522.1 hypothetical protein AeNC1_004495 [Aphanomyces euteiches]